MIGRFQLGQTVMLRVKCASLPDDAPYARVYGPSGLVVVKQLPIEDKYATTGQFALPLYLDSSFSAGQYQVVFLYRISGALRTGQETFEIVGGGGADGGMISTYFYALPQADFVIAKRENGKITSGRNPSL